MKIRQNPVQNMRLYGQYIDRIGANMLDILGVDIRLKIWDAQLHNNQYVDK